MPAGHATLLMHHLRRMVDAQSTGHLTDRELVERFARERDEMAFSALLRRHGPMVLRVCRRVLLHDHDAEDAFQATFMVLARKAGSLLGHESAAGWLHEVARRVALKSRGQAGRTLIRVNQTEISENGDPLEEITGRELVATLDQELARLAEKYRSPLILCYLEGLTQDEAARRLGQSLSTFKRRLERGREILRVRLTRRGLALTATLSVALLSPTMASAIPAALLKSTTQAAVGVAVGQAAAGGSISAQVAALTEGVLRAMFLTKLKTAAILLMTVSLISIGTGLVALRPSAGAAEDEEKSSPSTIIKKAPRANSDEIWQEWLTLRGPVEPPVPTVGHVLSLSFTPDGKSLATVMADKSVIVWDAKTGKEIKKLKDVADQAQTVAWSPDGKILASAADDNIARLWDLASGKEIRALSAQKGTIAKMAFSPDGKTLASASSDQLVAVWDVATGKMKFLFLGRSAKKDIRTVAYSPDGKLMALANEDDAVILLDASSGKILLNLVEEADCKVQSLAFSPSGKILAGLSDASRVSLWDVKTGKMIAGLKDAVGLGGCLAFSPDGKRLALAGKDHAIILCDVATMKIVATLKGHQTSISSVVFSPDGKFLASGSADGSVILWIKKSGEPTELFIQQGSEIATDRFNALIAELLKAKRSDEQIVEALFLATLARLPTETERAFMLQSLEKQRDNKGEAYKELVKSLTQTKEFNSHVAELHNRATRQRH